MYCNKKAGRGLWRGCVSALVALGMALTLVPPASAAQNTQVASGDLHYLAIKADGTLWTWGDNYYGQLGNGKQGKGTERDKPVKVMENVTAADGGRDHSLALRSDGSVWAWGKNDWGQLGDGTKTGTPTPKKVLEGVRSISAGGSSSAAVKTDGSLWIWGYSDDELAGSKDNIGNRLAPAKVMENVASVTLAPGLGTYVVKTDGSLWAWGVNEDGELGNGRSPKRGSYDHVRMPFKVMDGVKDVAAGRSHTLVLKKDGTVWAFGNNTSGQIGNGTEISPFAGRGNLGQLKPVQVLDNVKAIAAGGSHSLAITNDNVLWAWGSNRKSQRERTGANVLTPIRTMDDVSSVASYGAYTLAVKTDGSLWFWRSGAVSGAGNSNEYTGEPEMLWRA